MFSEYFQNIPLRNNLYIFSYIAAAMKVKLYVSHYIGFKATWNKPESKQFYCSVVSLIVMRKDYVDYSKPPRQHIF